MGHRPLLRSQSEAETALSRKRSGTLCSPPLARNGDSGGGQRRGRLRGIEREQLHGHVCVFAITERLVEAKGGGWSVSCKPCEKRSFPARLWSSRRCLESGVTHFLCCCLYCHDDDGVQQHIFSPGTCMSKMFARTTDGASTRATVSRLVAWCIYETHLLCFSYVTVAMPARSPTRRDIWVQQFRSRS